MYQVKSLTGKQMRIEALTSPPFGPRFTEEQVSKAVKMEIWCTNFSDPGDDYTEFRLIDAEGKIISTKTINGF